MMNELEGILKKVIYFKVWSHNSAKNLKVNEFSNGDSVVEYMECKVVVLSDGFKSNRQM